MLHITHAFTNNNEGESKVFSEINPIFNMILHNRKLCTNRDYHPGLSSSMNVGHGNSFSFGGSLLPF